MALVKLKTSGYMAKGILTGTKYNLRFWEDTKKDPCVYCGGPANTIEHVIPRSAGGKDHADNKVRACETCNRTRKSTPLLFWLLSLSAATLN